MTIRERGGKVQLIRNQYSAEKKRGVQVVLGTFDRFLSSANEVDSMLLEQLTADERGQLDAWFAEKQQKRTEDSIKYAPATVVRNLDVMAEHYDPAQVSDEQITAIKVSLSALLEARRKWKKAAR